MSANEDSNENEQDEGSTMRINSSPTKKRCINSVVEDQESPHTDSDYSTLTSTVSSSSTLTATINKNRPLQKRQKLTNGKNIADVDSFAIVSCATCHEKMMQLSELDEQECDCLLFNYFLNTTNSSEHKQKLMVKMTGSDLLYIQTMEDLKEIGLHNCPTIKLRRIVAELQDWKENNNGYVPSDVTKFIRSHCCADSTHPKTSPIAVNIGQSKTSNPEVECGSLDKPSQSPAKGDSVLNETREDSAMHALATAALVLSAIQDASVSIKKTPSVISDTQSPQDLITQLQAQPQNIPLVLKLCDKLLQPALSNPLLSIVTQNEYGHQKKPPLTIHMLPAQSVVLVVILLLDAIAYYIQVTDPSSRQESESHREVMVMVLKCINSSLNRIEAICEQVNDPFVNLQRMLHLPRVSDYVFTLQHLLVYYEDDLELIMYLLAICLSLIKVPSWSKLFLSVLPIVPASFGSNHELPESLPTHSPQFVTSLMTVLGKYKHRVHSVKLVIVLIKTLTTSQDASLLFLQCPGPLLLQTPESLNNVNKNPTCELLRVILQLHANDLWIIKGVLSVMWNFSMSSFGKQCLIEVGVPMLLVEVFMKHNSYQYHLCQMPLLQLCGCIWALSQDNDTKELFGTHGVCERLVQILRHFLQSSNLQQIAQNNDLPQGLVRFFDQVLGAIGSMAVNPRNQIQLNRCNVCGLLIDVLQMFSSRRSPIDLMMHSCDCVVETVCGAMWTMMELDTVEDEQTRTNLTITNLGCDILLHTMEKYSSLLTKAFASSAVANHHVVSLVAVLRQLCGALSVKLLKSAVSRDHYFNHSPMMLDIFSRTLQVCLVVSSKFEVNCNVPILESLQSTVGSLLSMFKHVIEYALYSKATALNVKHQALVMHVCNTKSFLDLILQVVSFVFNTMCNTSSDQKRSLCGVIVALLDLFLLSPELIDDKDRFLWLIDENKQSVVAFLMDVLVTYTNDQLLLLSGLRLLQNLTNKAFDGSNLHRARTMANAVIQATLTHTKYHKDNNMGYADVDGYHREGEIIKMICVCIHNILNTTSSALQHSSSGQTIDDVVTDDSVSKSSLLSLLTQSIIVYSTESEVVKSLCGVIKAILSSLVTNLSASSYHTFNELIQLCSELLILYPSHPSSSSASNCIHDISLNQTFNLNLINVCLDTAMMHMHQDQIVFDTLEVLCILMHHMMKIFCNTDIEVRHRVIVSSLKQNMLNQSSLMLGVIESSLAVYGQDVRMVEVVCKLLRLVLSIFSEITNDKLIHAVSINKQQLLRLLDEACEFCQSLQLTQKTRSSIEEQEPNGGIEVEQRKSVVKDNSKLQRVIMELKMTKRLLLFVQ